MRKPMPPPPFDELLANGLPTASRILSVLRHTEDTYQHWDDLRYREPPGGLTHSEWWFGLKLGRAGQYRTIPLVDVGGKPFVYTLPDAALKMLQHIERFCSGNISLPEQITTAGRRDHYIITSLIEEAITSSQLEGASTSRQVAKQMIESGRKPRDKSEHMILNNFGAMQRVGELRDEPLSTERLFELHRIVTARTLRDPSLEGALQKPGDDRVAIFAPGGGHTVLHTPPPAEQLPQRVALLTRFASEEQERYLPPVVKAIILHFWLAYDHPFEDGNGRTARALFYWSMLHDGYWLAEFLTVSKILKRAPAKYARSFLLTESDDNDLTYFVLYQLQVICEAIDELLEYLRRKSRELSQVRGLLQHDDRFNHRQVALLAHAIRHPDDVFTIKEHMMHHSVVYETARSDLLALHARALLDKRRAGREFIFVPAADLAAQLDS